MVVPVDGRLERLEARQLILGPNAPVARVLAHEICLGHRPHQAFPKFAALLCAAKVEHSALQFPVVIEIEVVHAQLTGLEGVVRLLVVHATSRQGKHGLAIAARHLFHLTFEIFQLCDHVALRGAGSCPSDYE